MLKYVETMVAFAEIPDEISLCINISNCPCHCVGCHSSHLAQDIGTELNWENLQSLIRKNKGVTCVAFMGGDAAPQEINKLAEKIQTTYCFIKVAWYSGREIVPNCISLKNFNYIKIGPFIPERGPLDNSNTNQIMYQIIPGSNKGSYDIIDITYKFHN